MIVKDGQYYLPQIKELILEYTKNLKRDLSFQKLDEELLNLAEKYTTPNGEILVAVDDNDKVWGVVAYHRHNGNRCEMKRLYVKPETRGLHLGDTLVEEIIEHAQAAGYKEMVLDTIEPLQAAISLYKKHGFSECDAYYQNPMNDVIYMKKYLEET